MKRYLPWLAVVGCLLIVAKLSGLTALSWWIVTLPLWIIPAIGALIFLVGCVAVFWIGRKQ